MLWNDKFARTSIPIKLGPPKSETFEDANPSDFYQQPMGKGFSNIWWLKMPLLYQNFQVVYLAKPGYLEYCTRDIL